MRRAFGRGGSLDSGGRTRSEKSLGLGGVRRTGEWERKVSDGGELGRVEDGEG